MPLAAGIVDLFDSRGLTIVGPTAAAARLEGSKIFAKDFMARHQIPTAAYRVAESPERAIEYLRSGEFGSPAISGRDQGRWVGGRERRSRCRKPFGGGKGN